MDKKSVKAALGRRRLESQHIGDTKPESNEPGHTDLGDKGGQPTMSSGGAMVSISVQPSGVDAESNAQAASAEKLSNMPASAVKQPKLQSTPWNQGGTKGETPNGMHQIVDGESGDFERATAKNQQGGNKKVFADMLNATGMSPMRKAMAAKGKKND